MKKRGFILLILIAVLWWWHFYRARSSSKNEILPAYSEKQKADITNAEQKEKELQKKLIRKAEDAFLSEYGRKPENLTDLIDKGFLSPGIYHTPPG